MNRILLTLLVLSFSLSLSGRSVIRLQPANDEDRTLGRWRYTVRVTAKGTRSEGQTGRLYYSGQQIPSRFHEIRNNMGRFLFFEGKHRWGAHGWMKQDSTTASSMGQVRKIIGRSAKKRGWYPGRLQRINTPKSWVQVRRGSEYYWAAPEKLLALAQTKGWSHLKAHRWERMFKQ